MDTTPTDGGRRILVIGHGRSDRGDASAGALAALRVASWGLPEVRALAVQGLTRELIGPLVRSEVAIFLDSCRPGSTEGPVLEPLRPQSPPRGGAGVDEPGYLLSLACDVYGRCPRAWHVRLPAESFVAGGELSPTAAWGLDATTTLLADWFDRMSGRVLQFALPEAESESDARAQSA